MSKQLAQAIILAAGKSKRFNTGNSKLLEKLCGQELILYPAKLLETLMVPSTFVLNYQADEIKKVLQSTVSNATYVLQPNPKGTGDALAHTQATWDHDHILVMNGDMPLVTEEIITQLINKHVEKNATVSFVTAHHPHPSATAYGRVISQDNTFKIIEAKDLQEQHESCCINAGIYLFNKNFLRQNITMLTNENAASEFYITDLIKIASDKGLSIQTISAPFDHIRGINTLKELWTAEQIKRSELISMWMERGVRFDVAQSVHLDVNIQIGAGTRIGAGAHILQGTTIGNNCIINPFGIIKNSTIGDDCLILPHTLISDSFIERECKVGPFAHIKDKSYMKDNTVVGNFVEVCRTTMGSYSKAKHLSYLGDTEMGHNVNVGAGTITCNYDGKQKHTTIIEDEVFIGSNNTLIAPITIQKKSYTAAGSTITDDVPTENLALGRARQINKDGYAKKFNNKKNQATQKKNKEKHSAFFGAIKTHNDLLEQ